MKPYAEFILSKDQIFKAKDGVVDANFTNLFGSQRIAAHWIKLLPKQRSSYPHAESHEEEFIYIVSGRPHVWVNGFIYQLEPGYAIGFPAGTGIAHCFLNNTDLDVEMIVLGERTKKENKCSFPIHHELKSSRSSIWWEDFPKQSLGGHNGEIGNLNFQRDVKEIPFIKNISDLKRSKSFSYPDDVETFTSGARLTDHVDLKSIGVWHEVLSDGDRTSWPHAHRREEEFAIILKGTATVWLNGYTYDINPGDCVYFKPGTNIAHVIMNQSGETVEFLGFGEAEDPKSEDRIIYPLHPTRNETCKGENFFWNDAPAITEYGPHLGVPLNKNILVTQVTSAEFLNRSEPVLCQHEAEYGLMLGLTQLRLKNPVENDSYRYFLIEENLKICAGAVITDKNIILSKMSDKMVYVLVLRLKELNMTVPGVVGPTQTVEFFNRHYKKENQIQSKMVMDQKIYQLDQVIPAPSVDGNFTVAQIESTDLSARWLLAFIEECIPHEPSTLENAQKIMIRKIENQELFIWVNQFGVPVALNMVMRPTRNGITVSFVYTPPEHRKKGYASALVAATSQRMLDAGKKFCVLYTDATNPTSNGIYQKIGYRQIATSKNFIFLESSSELQGQ